MAAAADDFKRAFNLLLWDWAPLDRFVLVVVVVDRTSDNFVTALLTVGG